MQNKSIKLEKKPIKIDAGTVSRNWEYSPEPRLEGLLKQLKYIKWKNITD